MILPKKQLSLEESYFGFGGFLLKKVSNPMTIDDLWVLYIATFDEKKYSVKFSFDQFLLALDYLFLIGAIKQNTEGMILNEIS